ncbi:hypothetical protein V6N11_081291 [Hibiscus sabdariffa]|uniref:Uncharacterized protein n=1 Tax=Hibiscus sabdariffa TaxID=183260 RepID=A0ABR2QJH0_9ROSI
MYPQKHVACSFVLAQQLADGAGFLDSFKHGLIRSKALSHELAATSASKNTITNSATAHKQVDWDVITS